MAHKTKLARAAIYRRNAAFNEDCERYGFTVRFARMQNGFSVFAVDYREAGIGGEFNYTPANIVAAVSCIVILANRFPKELQTFVVEFYWDPWAGGFAVSIPDLQGCNTQGDTLEDSCRMLIDAANGWLDLEFR